MQPWSWSRRNLRSAVVAALCLPVLAALVLSVKGGTGGHSQRAAGVASTTGPHGDRGVEAAEREGFPPEDLYLFERTATGSMPTARDLAAAGAQAARVERETRTTAPRLAAARWRFLGPANIGARVVDVAVDPRRASTLYVASATGGVWKSTDAAKTFHRIWSNRFPQSMGAIAMTSTGVLYAGTGEVNPGGGSITYGGGGIYRSTDRGATWRRVGLRDSRRIGRIVIDPRNPRHVLVAVAGSLFDAGGPRGLFETRNGGGTWTKILSAPNRTTGAVDVAVDPRNPKDILVAMWDHIRYPDYRRYTGAGSGIWRSTDGGRTFERQGPANGLPPSSDEVGRIGVTFDPSDPSRAYAIYANNREGSFEAFFGSVDGGAHWAAMPGNSTLGASQSVYGWWFGRVWVDPRDSNHIFIAGLELYESVDGGASFAPQTSQHPDQHAMAWDPHVEGRVYLGNDGGMYRSDSDGADSTWKHSAHEPWSQFFTIDVSRRHPSRRNGGLQDNGSVRTWGRKKGKWNAYYGGDGVKNLINPRDKRNVFACSQYGSCARSDDGGKTMDEFDQNTQSDRYGWLAPIEFQPGSGRIMYFAGDILHRSPDRGRTWTAISPDLGKGDRGRETNPLYANHYGTIQAIGLNALRPRTIYAGTDNGYLWKTRDLGGHWRQIVAGNLPKRWITHIAVERRNPRVLYVSFSGFRSGDQTAYLVRSRDGGRTWRDVTRNLPKAPINDVLIVGKRLYVATDVGVFRTRAKPIRWLYVGHGLPRAPVNDIRWIGRTRTLFAGTFGRGLYAIRPPKP